MARSTIKSAVISMNDLNVSASPLGYFIAPQDITVVGIYMLTSTAVAKSGSTYGTVYTYDDGDEGVVVDQQDIANSTTEDAAYKSPVAVTAKVPWTVNLNQAIHLEIREGDVLEFAPTEAGGDGSFDTADTSYILEYYVGHGEGHSSS